MEKRLLFNQKSWEKLARKTWPIQGDRNSKVFHNRAKQNRTSMTIFRLKNDLGQWTDSHDEFTNILS